MKEWKSEPVLDDVQAEPAAAHDPEVSRFGLHEATTAYEQLRLGAVEGRAVVVPNAAYTP